MYPLHLLLLLNTVTGLYQPPRLNMIQRQSCYYTPYSKQLTCQCAGEDTNTFLQLRLMFFIKEKGQEVRSVVIESCLDLLIELDLTGVNPTEIPFKFKNCGRVSFDSINFDARFAGSQLLKIDLDTVNSAKLQGLAVEEAVQISTTRVKELILHQSNFTHLPMPGLTISQTDKLSVTDCVFERISPGSISIESAKEVVVVNNQFSINAIQVVKSNGGSSLYISCNRLLGVPGSPECVPTSTQQPVTVSTFRISSTSRSTSTTTAPPPPFTTHAIMPGAHSSVVSMELLVGLVVGVGVLVIVLLFIVVYLCCRRKRSKKEKIEAKEAELDQEKMDILTEKDADVDSGNNSGDSLEESEEKDSLLSPETPEEEHEILVEASKPKFSSPIWLDEIQNNKIFNKQKSINTEETPRRPDRPFPVRSISEIIEQDSESEDENTDKSVDTAIDNEETCCLTQSLINANEGITSDIKVSNASNKNGEVIKAVVPETDF